MDVQALNADLQALATKHQVHITGKATPVSTDEDAFDVTAQAEQPATDTATDTGSDTTGEQAVV